MASTRSINTPGNYYLEQKQYHDSKQYKLYKNSQYGEAWNTNLCGNGLLPGQLPREKLSYNPVEIESFLFGVNSTNLVNREPPLIAQLISLPDVNIYNKNTTILMPLPLVVEKNRPYPI